MERKDYIKRTDALLLKVLRIEREFNKIIVDYYDAHPSEVGNKKTDFYKEMTSMIATYERGIDNMKSSLDEPEIIQRIPVGE